MTVGDLLPNQKPDIRPIHIWLLDNMGESEIGSMNVW